MTHAIDVIDQLAGVRPGDRLDRLRGQRPATRLHAQQSHLALFEPAAPPEGTTTDFTSTERHAVAVFVTELHAQPDLVAFYLQGLERLDAASALRDAVIAEARAGEARGPYGRYPAGPLSAEDRVERDPTPDAARRAVLGPRLAAALVHARLLVLHPRDAKASDLQALLDASWSTTDVVTLSQLVAFLSFQVRVAAGLRALADRPSSASAAA